MYLYDIAENRQRMYLCDKAENHQRIYWRDAEENSRKKSKETIFIFTTENI